MPIPPRPPVRAALPAQTRQGAIRTTPARPGIAGYVTGVMERFREVFIGSPATPQTFDPGVPADPRKPLGAEPRKFQFRQGINIAFTPRTGELITFATLKNLVDNCDLLRIIIERAKDVICAEEWGIVGREEHDKPDPARVRQVVGFLQKPDGRHSWSFWMRMLLENIWKYDANPIYKRRNRGGGIYGFQILDGSTIKPLLDQFGESPDPPVPAFSQVVYGYPEVYLTSDELYYPLFCPKPDTPYGMSKVEQLILHVNMEIRRVLYNLGEFNEGNAPAGTGEMPEDWSELDIEEFQHYFDMLLAGDPNLRSRIKMVPHGFKLTKFKDDEKFKLHNEFDEWIARVFCYGIGMSYQGFVRMMNRATAQQANVQQQEEGLEAMRQFLTEIVNTLIWDGLDYPDLRFTWTGEHDHSADSAVKRDVAYVTTGIWTKNEVRARLGDPPLEEIMAQENQQASGTGFTPHKDDAAQAAEQENAPHGGEEQTDVDEVKPSAEDEKSARVELRRWERKALKAVRAGKPPTVPFVSEVLPTATVEKVTAGLAKASPKNMAEVRRVFRLAEEGEIYVNPPKPGEGAPHRARLRTLLTQVGLRVVEEAKVS